MKPITFKQRRKLRAIGEFFQFVVAGVLVILFLFFTAFIATSIYFFLRQK